jgi:hypothetical protein
MFRFLENLRLRFPVDKCLVFVHSQIHHFFTPKYNESTPSKDILVFLEIGVGIGDAILSIDALWALRRMFPIERGYSIKLLCTLPVRNFFTAIGMLHEFDLLETVLVYDTHLYKHYRGTKLLISADTGTVHLAAAVRTQSICVIGRWHYGSMHPYKPDIVRPEDRLPVCVYNLETIWPVSPLSSEQVRLKYTPPS